MSLATILQGGIAIANTVTASLQATVTHKAYASDDGYGKPTYSTGVARTAIVERRQKFVRTRTGEEKLSLARILFLVPVTVDERDLITLPDGSEMPILRIGGPVDGTTNAEFVVEVELG
tara:strand:+ start:199 stop:555 length:357 start_codon:yes stop_codon:yes gene_type:complete